jgi:hypothetical protein
VKGRVRKFGEKRRIKYVAIVGRWETVDLILRTTIDTKAQGNVTKAVRPQVPANRESTTSIAGIPDAWWLNMPSQPEVISECCAGKVGRNRRWPGGQLRHLILWRPASLQSLVGLLMRGRGDGYVVVGVVSSIGLGHAKFQCAVI